MKVKNRYNELNLGLNCLLNDIILYWNIIFINNIFRSEIVGL